jgi:CheY-like chemotaxis protein
LATDESEDAGLVALPEADGETVLVIEDEPVVRGLIVEVVADLGFTALEATDGPGGLEVLQSRKCIDLLITDVGLPGRNGRQLAELARARHPNLPVLLMTGYAGDAVEQAALPQGIELICKPFSLDALAGRVLATLDLAGRINQLA